MSIVEGSGPRVGWQVIFSERGGGCGGYTPLNLGPNA